MVTPELISLLVAAIGLAGLLFQKSKCFVRHVGQDTDWGVGFTDVNLVNTPPTRNNALRRPTVRVRPSPTISGRAPK